MDKNLDGKVTWDEYWAWVQVFYLKKGWKIETIKGYKNAFKRGFNLVAGKKGYMTFAEFMKALRKKYGIKKK